MSVELAQKSLTIEEVYNVAVENYKVKVGRILSNELSNNAPKKIKAKQTDLLGGDYPVGIKKSEYLRAYFLIVLSRLAKMKKAGRKNTVELVTALLNSRIG